MYSNGINRVLSALIETSSSAPIGTKFSRMKALWSIMCAMDPDVYWEAAALSILKLKSATETLQTLVDNVESAVRNPTTRSTMRPVFPTDFTAPTTLTEDITDALSLAATRRQAIENTENNFRDLFVGLKAFYRAIDNIRVISSRTPLLYNDYVTEYLESLKTTYQSRDTEEAIEMLGMMNVIAEVTSSTISYGSIEKYRGALAVVQEQPATIRIYSGPYNIPSGTAVTWIESSPTATPNTWTPVTPGVITLIGGSGYNFIPPAVPNNWDFSLGDVTFTFRINNTTFGPYIIASGVYTTAQIIAILQPLIAVLDPTGHIQLSENANHNFIISLGADNTAEGIQVYIPATPGIVSFNEACELAGQWVTGTRSSLGDTGPTLISRFTTEAGIAATITAAGHINVASTVDIAAGDIVRVHYSGAVANPPLDASYIVDSVTPGSPQDVLVLPYYGSTTTLFTGPPTYVVGVPCSVSIDIARDDATSPGYPRLVADTYLEIGNPFPEIGITGITTEYAYGTVLTLTESTDYLGGYRVGDIVYLSPGSTPDTLVAVDPIRISTIRSLAYTSGIIRSGLAAEYSLLSIPSILLRPETNIEDAVSSFMQDFTWGGFIGFSRKIQPILDAAISFYSGINTTLSPFRTKQLVSILHQQGFDIAAAYLETGRIYEFLDMPVESSRSSTAATTILQSLRV